MQTYEAWVVERRPVFARLPGINGGYTDNSPTDWLTDYWDGLLLELKAKAEEAAGRQMNPLTCDPEWLDYLAPLAGFDANHWQIKWSEQTKRTLISNAFTLIWKDKGSREVLSLVLGAVGLRHEVIVQGDFLVGISEVGDPIGELPWDYTIFLPPEYQYREEEQLAQWVNERFGPCWCRSRIVFDPERFQRFDLLEAATDTALATQADEALRAD